ncbi:MAG: response regulator [Deltaproteobacteria bacterium]|nr:response regulator [Deltaproteobacteria bacterium]
MTIRHPRVFFLSGSTPCSEGFLPLLETLKARCQQAAAKDPREATYLVGLGDVNAWPQINAADLDARLVYAWFEDFVEQSQYEKAIERFNRVVFLHGSQGLDELVALLEDGGVVSAGYRSDPLADDAFFRLKGDYLFGLKDEFEKAVPIKEDNSAYIESWKSLLSRIAGSAGAYEFSTLSEVAQEAFEKYREKELTSVALKKLRERLQTAISEEFDNYNRQVEACLPKPVELDVRQRVLALVDDLSITNQLRFALSHSRIEVEFHADPAHTLTALHLAQPDILIIQQELMHFDGLDLAAQLRNIKQLQALPILVLLKETSEATLTRAIRSGVDGWLSTPFSAANVALSVLNLLRRVELARQLGGRDPVTGLYTKEAMADRLRGDLSRVRRSGQQLAVLLIHLTLSDSPRLAFLDLANTANKIFRQSDLLSRYNEATLAAVLPGIDMRTILSVINRFRLAFDAHHPCAVAATISDGSCEPEDLLADVETRLSHVLKGATESAIGSLRTDLKRKAAALSPRILIADTDEAIVSLLRFFCAREGFEVHAARNGTDTMDFLEKARETDSLPDVLVLEAFLPGIDGFRILERVTTDFGNRISVIMLSVHPSEERVSKALQLGAVDFVAKPFRVPEIIARIRNALIRTWAN